MRRAQGVILGIITGAMLSDLAIRRVGGGVLVVSAGFALLGAGTYGLALRRPIQDAG